VLVFQDGTRKTQHDLDDMNRSLEEILERPAHYTKCGRIAYYLAARDTDLVDRLISATRP